MSPSHRQPKGYQGTDHEMIGSSLLAVMATLTSAQAVLGDNLVERLKQIEPQGWYPIDWMLEINEAVDRNVGRSGLRQLGRQLFRSTHAGDMKDAKGAPPSVRDVLFGINTIYRQANRGEAIGGWRMLEFQPGSAIMEKTTPHHCVMEEGIIAELLTSIGIPALVQQTECFRDGAEACLYRITAPVYDERWTGRG